MGGRLPDFAWKTSYRHEDGDLVGMFYIPALLRAVAYDRMTGYFSAGSLALASRGLEGLIRNSGTMRLVVGCTLEEDEIAALEVGYAARAGENGALFARRVAEKLGKTKIEPPDEHSRNGLGKLAFMVGAGLLEVKVAVPIRPGTLTPERSPGLYHEKVGVITDFEGNRIGFSGSMNETAAAWTQNRESFHLHCSWEGEREHQHVADEVRAFDRLWTNENDTVWTMDFPEAEKQRLLEFMPTDDRFVGPPTVPVKGLPEAVEPQTVVETTTAPEPPERPKWTPEEIRDMVWGFFARAPQLPNGVRIGEVTSTVKPWPHQIRSFERMWKAWPFRLLEASEVGLGKTICAGLIIRQAWLSRRARRILLLVPKAVIVQWQSEMYEKFNLNIPIYDGQSLCWKQVPGWTGPVERKVGPKEWTEQPLVLASSHLMRRKDRAAGLVQAKDWDLLVLDEAHHARRKGAGSKAEKGPNALLKLMQELAPKAKSLLLLTATPMQVHPVEVFDLLKLLGLPEGWDEGTFLRYFELSSGNPDLGGLNWLAEKFRETEIAYGALSDDDVAEVAATSISNLGRRRILKALRDSSEILRKRLDGTERAAALGVLRKFSPVRFLMSRHTRGLLREYHKAGLLSTPIATRQVQDILVEFTASERRVYDAVENYIATTYNNAAGDEKNAVGFVMTIYRRRLASSFHALKCTLNKRLLNLSALGDDPEDLLQDEMRDDIMSEEEGEELAKAALDLVEGEDVKILLKEIAKLGDTDTKARRLIEELEKVFAEGFDSAIVFTQFTDTMAYLAELLAERLPDISIGTYSGKGGEIRGRGGNWTKCSKEKIKKEMKEKRIGLLVATDAAGEGLNLQFCGVLANFDLPWNPMKVEQRIGRIDRIGQEHPVIRILNFGYKDTVEADVYLALGERINLFQGLVGKLQPILSRLPQEFEKLALAQPMDRDRAREAFMAEIDREVLNSENSSFDIDAASPESLELPNLPPPAYRLEDFETAMGLHGVKPLGWGWNAAETATFNLSVPGHDAFRVTTDPAVFDDHPENIAFFSPGIRFLDEIIALHFPEYDDFAGTMTVSTTPDSFASPSALVKIGKGGKEETGVDEPGPRCPSTANSFSELLDQIAMGPGQK